MKRIKLSKKRWVQKLQLKTTKRWIKRFKGQTDMVYGLPRPEQIDPRIWQAMIDAVNYKLGCLKKELAVYKRKLRRSMGLR